MQNLALSEITLKPVPKTKKKTEQKQHLKEFLATN